MKEFLKRSVRILGTRNLWHFLKGYVHPFSSGIIWCSLCLVPECAWRKSFLHAASLLFRKVSRLANSSASIHKSFQEISFLDTVFGSFRYLNSGTAVGSCGKQAKHILASNKYRRNIFGSNLWQELALFLVVLLNVNVC
jgi:hypothetical protein